MYDKNKRAKYIDEKYAAYASPAMDAYYHAHSQINNSAVQNPVIFRCLLVVISFTFIIFTSCAVKTSSRDWVKIGICGFVIVTVYFLSTKAFCLEEVG